MGNTRDQVGKAGLFVASGIFRTAFYVCVAVLIFWIGKSAYQFGYNVFNQQAVSPGAGQEVTVVIPEGSSTYDVAKILKSKGLIDDSLVFFAQEKLSTYKGQMKAGTYLLSTAYTPTRIMGILAGDEEQTGVTQDTAATTDTQTADTGTADTQTADAAEDGTAKEGESAQ
ncbi:endolytic transglycosylase MltG [Blautia sp. HCP3S3_H10_1]|uniref:endolytic transglycosylase MltG n=1 Tax=unclassified Blautia TaxID=2648079 RepID=UPI003F9070D6|nr:endolytic transglycosylase MltG [Clostridia bacterium]